MLQVFSSVFFSLIVVVTYASLSRIGELKYESESDNETVRISAGLLSNPNSGIDGQLDFLRSNSNTNETGIFLFIVFDWYIHKPH